MTRYNTIVVNVAGGWVFLIQVFVDESVYVLEQTSCPPLQVEYLSSPIGILMFTHCLAVGFFPFVIRVSPNVTCGCLFIIPFGLFLRRLRSVRIRVNGNW